MISGLYFGVSFAVRPVSGPAITKLNKKLIMILTYALGVVTNAAYAFCGSIPFFVAVRVLHGIEFAFIGSLGLTVATDSLPKEKLASGLGIYGIGGAIAMIVGPAMGIVVRDWGDAAWGAGAGYRLVFATAAAFMLIGLIPASLTHTEAVQGNHQLSWSLVQEYNSQGSAGHALIICCIRLRGAFQYYMLPYAEEKGIANISLFFTVYAWFCFSAGPFSGSLPIGWACPRYFIPPACCL